MRLCTANGCDSQYFSNGYCKRHYEKWRRFGDPLHVASPRPPRACSVTGCDGRHEGKGFCRFHYKRWRRYGDPLAEPVRLAPADRFFAKVKFSETKFHNGIACLEWTAFRNHLGYGQFQLANQKPVGAHRWLYQHWFGDIPEGLHLDHLCRNTSCCNPAHLEPVTPAENVRRGAAVRYAVLKSHCKNGHELTPANTLLDRKGARVCRTCRRAAQRRYKAKQREFA